MNKTIGAVREKESNRLEKIALNYNAKNKIKYITNKDKYAWKLIKFDLEKFVLIRLYRIIKIAFIKPKAKLIRRRRI